MLKRYRFIVILSLALVAIGSALPGNSGTVRAQTRHVYLEEFTGAWCGYCVRGAYAVQKIDQNFPGQSAIVCYHIAEQGGPDLMANAQGDSMASAVGFPSAEVVQGFPDGWTARTTEGSNWNVDPATWADSVQALFEGGSYGLGLVDAIIQQQPSVQCNVTNVSFNQSTGLVTATVSATFATALAGDFRFNIIVTEDSVSGAGAGYDQHNYYSSTDIGNNYPNNPMLSYPEVITGWQHMHVFREAVAGIYGLKGIIPANVAVGGTYNTTFTFPLPTTILNPNHVHLVGSVFQYNSSNVSENTVFDAMDVRLSNTTIPSAPNDITVSADNGNIGADNITYLSAHAGGDTTYSLTLQNTGNSPVSVTLQLDPTTPLPNGWSVSFAPQPATVDANSNQTVTLTIGAAAAAKQAAFEAPNILVLPQEEGVYIPSGSFPLALLSDNTQYPMFYDAPDGATGIDAAVTNALPDSMRAHAVGIPLSADFITYFPPENYPLSIYDNIAILDNGNYYSNPTILPNITNALAAGEKVLLISDEALYFAEDPSAPSAAETETSDVQAFYATLGIDWNSTTNHYSTQTGAAEAYTIKGTTDPIGNGITVSNAGGTYVLNSVYSIDSNSFAVFYSGKSDSTDVIGSRYQDPVTQSKIVYLGFDLSGITTNAGVDRADTIAGRSIAWLIGAASAGVAEQGVSSTGITASPNPFNGISQIQYTAAPNELNVTFAAYDLLGRQVATLTTQNQGGNVYSATFDASKLAAGTYVIEAHSSTGTHEIRVVNQQ